MGTQWTMLKVVYLVTQVVCYALQIIPLGYLRLWRKHAYIQRLHVALMVIRGQFMAVYCTFLIHEFPIWQGGLDSTQNGCWPVWIIGHFAFSTGLIAEIFSLLHMWLVYTVDYLQSSTAKVIACEYNLESSVNAVTRAFSQQRQAPDRQASSHSFSSIPSVGVPMVRSYALDLTGSVLARIALWVFETPGMELTWLTGGHSWVLKSTGPDGHLPVVTRALRYRTRAKVAGALTWLFTLFFSMGVRKFAPPKYSYWPSLTQPCTGNDMTGLVVLSALTTFLSFLIVVATHPFHAQCTEEMRFLRWTCGWRVFWMGILGPCYLATWFQFPRFELVLARFGPWVFPVAWEMSSGILRSWSPVLIVWLQMQRDRRHWENLPQTRLQTILADPSTAVTFGEFCARQHCSEAFHFCLDFQRCFVTGTDNPSEPKAPSTNLVASPEWISGNGRGSKPTTESASSESGPSLSDGAQQWLYCDSPRQPRTEVSLQLGPTESVRDSGSPTPYADQAKAAAMISPFVVMDQVEEPGPLSKLAVPEASDPLDVRLRYFALQYIEQGSPREVNISAASRQRFLETLSVADATVALAAIHEHVFRILLQGVYARYDEGMQVKRSRKRRRWRRKREKK